MILSVRTIITWKRIFASDILKIMNDLFMRKYYKVKKELQYLIILYKMNDYQVGDELKG